MDFILDDFNPVSIAKKLAQRMRKRRLFLNMSQKLLSEKSGVSWGSIKRFESSGEISLKNLLKLALTLDALEEFHSLFPEKEYNSIDDILKSRKQKERKRGRNG
ncbi:MAG: XRE family transcriptional regulator [Bacteroidetes bacterium]|nr:MAG: XRE family transcriptional regulator [Bacteroidota bacterium]